MQASGSPEFATFPRRNASVVPPIGEKNRVGKMASIAPEVTACFNMNSLFAAQDFQSRSADVSDTTWRRWLEFVPGHGRLRKREPCVANSTYLPCSREPNATFTSTTTKA